MGRIQLRFENIQSVVGSDKFSVILLTDMQRKYALSMICDKLITDQLLMRINTPDLCRNMLPEALVELLPEGQYEIMIYGIHDGQYQVLLQDLESSNNVRLRISDGVLLSLITHYPLFIDETLMEHQRILFDENARDIAIPINAMNINGLKKALQKAVSAENYKLASQLRDEIERRKEDKE